MMTDPIADLLTRIRNGIIAKQERVEIPFSKVKLALLKILEQERYIDSSTVISEGQKGKILVTLRYQPNKESIITELHRISRPGLRVYLGYREIKPVLEGMGVLVLSTSRGIMTDKQAREAKLGGEVLCSIW